MKRIALSLLVAGLLSTPLLALPPPAQAGISVGIGVSVGIPPPIMPVYAQPIAPGAGYIWTPGYWGWDPATGYYWIPGTWVMPPQFGLLWTPGWWGWSSGFYRWHGGYWGTHVGFYGGVNYGFGYFGAGYVGGYWRGNRFFYNRAVNNVNITNVRNVYVDKTVINNYHNTNVNRVSYNGGRGGLTAQPTAEQRGWSNERRYQPTSMQTRQRDTAMRNPAQRFSANQGKPAVYATQHAGRFDGQHAVRAADAGMQQAPRHTMSAQGRQDGFVHAPRDRQPQAGAAYQARPSRNGASQRPYREAGDQSMRMQRNEAAAGRGPRAEQGPRVEQGSRVEQGPRQGAAQARGEHHGEARQEGQPHEDNKHHR